MHINLKNVDKKQIASIYLTCHMTSNLSCDMLLRPPNSLFRKLLLSLLRLLNLILLLLLSIHLVTTRSSQIKKSKHKNTKNHNTAISLYEKMRKIIRMSFVAFPRLQLAEVKSSFPIYTKTSVVCELRAKNERRHLLQRRRRVPTWRGFVKG